MNDWNLDTVRRILHSHMCDFDKKRFIRLYIQGFENDRSIDAVLKVMNKEGE